MSSDRPNAPPSENESSAHVFLRTVRNLDLIMHRRTEAAAFGDMLQIPSQPETSEKSRQSSFQIIQEILLQILLDRIAENLFGFRTVRIGRKIRGHPD